MLTEDQVRAQFGDVLCRSCKKPASYHALHLATHIKGTCVWTWLGVVKTALAAAGEASE